MGKTQMRPFYEQCPYNLQTEVREMYYSNTFAIYPVITCTLHPVYPPARNTSLSKCTNKVIYIARNVVVKSHATRLRFVGINGSSRALVLCTNGRFPALGGFILGAVYAASGQAKVAFAGGGLTTVVFCG